tara:strand:+ start:4418 stop:6046 length:1629 start_codon:yes stop_codon:yes gene_type:complete
MVGLYIPKEDKYIQCESADELAAELQDGDEVIMHNGIDFDYPVIAKVWTAFTWPDIKVVDTLVMSRLWCPTLLGGHSLKEWGKRLGDSKGDFTDFNEPADTEDWDEWQTRMGVYMEQDCRLTWRLHEHLLSVMRKFQVTRAALDLEHEVQWVVSDQVRNGMHFNLSKAQDLYAVLCAKRQPILEAMQLEFPPITTQRWSEKTGKQLKDKVEVFNPSSPPQIARRLQARGVVFTEFTEKTGAVMINNDILEEITHPAAASIKEYMMLGKRISQFDQWFEHLDPITHRIHGRVNSMGAGTYRMTQFKPNLAQIPATGKPYGRECRELFDVAEGNVLLGCDASGLELRCFASATGNEDYIKIVTEGDPHQYHADLLGVSRTVAKTFIYAFIYGAGNGKLGSIVGGVGADARALFLERLIGLQELKDKIEQQASKGFVEGLDGRRIRTKEVYSALNYRLQSDGALVMKKAAVNCHHYINTHWLMAPTKPMQVVAAHDEWQFEVLPEAAEHLGSLAVAAIEQAGRDFNMACPMTGEYMIGQSWAETH